MVGVFDLFWPKGKAIIFSKEKRDQLLNCCIQELVQFQERFILLSVSCFIETIPFPSLAPASLKLGYDLNLYDKGLQMQNLGRVILLMHRAL